MAFSLVSNTRRRTSDGNRWTVTAVADEVDSTGSYVAKATLGLSRIDSVQATVKESNVAVQAYANSQDGSTASNGDLFLKTASGTHDVEITVTGR